jgi:N-hydroxyarylamine O-acetyltransferase
VQAAGFLALVTSLGFDADLAGASIASPYDHLIVRVQLNGQLWLCDVGNGQPYLEPFPTDAPLRFEHLGWHFETRPAAGGVELRRASPDQPEPRLVYRASVEPRAWADFRASIDRHHHEPGFGPFLSGLRAVRMSRDELLTLRDTTLTRYRAEGHERWEIAEADLVRVLRDRLELAGLPVDEAVEAWHSNRRNRA